MSKVKINTKRTRFSSAPWFKENISVIIGGVGGIGSWLSLFLARQGCELHLYDMDVVDEVNLAGQLYGTSHIGMGKTVAIRGLVRDLSDNHAVYCNNTFDIESYTNDIVFSCFDNMKARKLFFEKWCTHINEETDEEGYRRAIFIDGRLLAEEGQVYFVTPDKIEEYKKTLFDDALVPMEDCSYKSTTYCSSLIASFMVAGYNNHMANVLNNAKLRPNTFKITYQLPILNFQVE